MVQFNGAGKRKNKAVALQQYNALTDIVALYIRTFTY